MKGRKKSIFSRNRLIFLSAAVGLSLMLLVAGEHLPIGKQVLAQNLPVHLEALRGNTWFGKECCNWEFTFTHKSGPFFRAQWKHPNGQTLADDNIVVNILDDNVEIIRAGGSSMGGCTYKGKIWVGHASGQYWCAGKHAGTWGATIRQ